MGERKRGVAAWKSAEHLYDHYDTHRREFPRDSVEDYDASAQETIGLGVVFTFRDRITRLRRTGYYHRETARLTVLDAEGLIVSHFRCAEDYVADLDRSS